MVSVCGLCGRVIVEGAPLKEEAIRAMCSALSHRGPDGEGVWLRKTAGGERAPQVGLGHRRLSVIDLSPAGGQPMPNEDETLWLVFNGEIYNFQELREGLKARGHRFRSRTDSEVILHLYEEKGEGLLQDLRGMFAFGLWDDPKGRLLLARDRLGEKPLVYAKVGKGLIFASEIKALFRDTGLAPRVDPQAIYHYLTFQYVPSPMSAFMGVEKIPPAHYLTWQDGAVRLHRYWAIPQPEGCKRERIYRPEELVERLEEAVRIRMVSDVAVGAFLSGGLDSSAVVALMSRHAQGPVRTLTVGFPDPGYDEVGYARLVSRCLGTDHAEIFVDMDIQRELPKIAWHYDEPFADASAVPTYYLAKAMRSLVTVALDGDGGDETLAGYDRYRAARWLGLYGRLPRPIRDGLIPRVLEAIPMRGWERSHWLHRARIFARPGEERLERRYGQWMSHFTAEEKASLCTKEFLEKVGQSDPLALMEKHFYCGSDCGDILQRVLGVDMVSYLPDDLLVKTDIASMAHGLEVRAPFLDHHFVEFASRIPSRYKVRWGRGKFILRQAFKGVLPPEVLARRKMGFSPPLARWIQRDLSEMAEELLMGSRARERGYFRGDRVGEILREHLMGIRNRHHQIWNLMMLELWHRVHVDGRNEAESS